MTAPGQKADGDNLVMSFQSSTKYCKLMYSLAAIQMRIHSIHF